ncbi:hypothetical protein HELRODRAFT_160088 [Helobdella robusta]|uniref:Uncharacterized protein n=1 Tax=Helobdella robusta TaxID=6412 RepID=T1EPR6_HELRO|nr:hypothetical protein HELRODRAFT_160088 [Helobdella robusta]ESO05984.1 hypothetical protein HELRODRAFT_160088 [Helobdella robusta]
MHNKGTSGRDSSDVYDDDLQSFFDFSFKDPFDVFKEFFGGRDPFSDAGWSLLIVERYLYRCGTVTCCGSFLTGTVGVESLYWENSWRVWSNLLDSSWPENVKIRDWTFDETRYIKIMTKTRQELVR